MDGYRSKDLTENLDNHQKAEMRAWVQLQLDAAVQELMNNGVVESLLVEAKPAWIFPLQILIGEIREQGDSRQFKWFICGEVPTDHLNSADASTPREAARHFAMKWQLDAARDQEGFDKQLADKAEALYALVDDARLWPQQSGF